MFALLRRHTTFSLSKCTCGLTQSIERSSKIRNINLNPKDIFCSSNRQLSHYAYFKRTASLTRLNCNSLLKQLSPCLGITYQKSHTHKYSIDSKEDNHVDTRSKWLTLPNVLTLGRLLVSPYIGYLVLCEQFLWAFGLVVLAGATDSLDGWIARNFKGQASNIGSYIDPLADKVMISVLTLSLTMVNVIPIPLCGLIIARDILLVVTSSHFHYKHLPPPKTLEKFFDFENSKVKMEPTQISKYNTFLQLGLVTLSVAAPVFGYLEHPLLHAYWYLVASTTVLSGISYIVKDKSAYIK